MSMFKNRTTAILVVIACATPALANFDLSWFTVDGGGGFCAGGVFELEGTAGQPDAGVPMTGGNFSLVGGFWSGAVAAGTGVPAATLTAAVSRKGNAAGPGGVCDLPLEPGPGSEPRQGGITEVRITFDTAPGGPGANPVALEQATCAAPAYVPYAGASTTSADVAGNELVITFSPGLENARTYRITLDAEVTSIPGQFVEVSGLLGDVNGDGLTNATDRSVVVGVWTGASHFSCPADLNSDAATNAIDRSIVVGSWTSGQNCAP
jgi:hypothetical protein